jgi:type I restriction enzyme M protein
MMLFEGHEGVNLDAESRQRIIDWLDLNAPLYGTYSWNKDAWRRPDADGEKALRAHIRQRFGDELAEQPFAALVNVALPSESRILKSPLALEASGWGQIERGGWKTVDDPDDATATRHLTLDAAIRIALANSQVVRVLAGVGAVSSGQTIYDPACGTGGMLLEALHYVKEHGGDENLMLGKLYGQEKNLTTSSIARMNLFLHGAEDFHIERGDTLRQPAFYSGDSLAVFDCVIANPPFSLEKWGDEVWVNDPYGRNFAGLPPAKSGDFAWVQHMIKSMAPKTGRMAVVLPHGVLFRMGKEGKIRRKLLEMDMLEAVIGLGPNLFYGTGLAACILVFRETKPREHRQKVLFIEASREFKSGRAQNELLPEHVERIHRWYVDYQDVEGICRVVTLDEIRENDFNLNIPRYVEPVIEEESMTIDEAIDNLKESLKAAYAAEDRLKDLLVREGML